MYKPLVACLLALAAAGAEARELHWRELAVRARFQNDGTLRITERHAMVFTGDSNGGERKFRVEPHQRLILHGLERGQQPLQEGSLDVVDRYALVDDHTLRWRSRAPSAPAFDNTARCCLRGASAPPRAAAPPPPARRARRSAAR